ncbi:Sporulation regulator protein [Halorhabdus tiamatea SARL4B]|uniref:Protein N-acetyltransferase homolog n=1 Tax=Halorhabdus tiamatea SARL4B TaxID=1033806 RepID=F7PP23_9EURY|nr:GNAT family N-acetyltransferase [Halorhabdus tiamatea]ERJ07188.1 Sporulation regulator protein [Halorhabdus tiamatea SARL4B]CCQ32809.1 protein N-acetyltransferase homolog [Halorhabdus tiamatea SARL4B]
MSDVDILADLWVDLADGQRAFGTHLAASANRSPVRESISRHVVTGRIRVARADDRIVGFVMFTLESDTLDRTVPRGIVENLYVVPDRREEGIGTELLEIAEAELRDEGATVVALDVLADNEAARAFYRSHGYDPHRLTVEKSIESDTSSKGQR